MITWRRLTAADFPLLRQWLAHAHVARWWNHATTPEAVERDFGAAARGEEPGEDMLALLDGEPVGLMQFARLADYPEDLAEFVEVAPVPEGAVMIDYLIGEPDRVGRGLGTRMIAAAVRRVWEYYPQAPAVVVAVAAGNVASWRALEKAGLQRVASGDMEPDHPTDPPLHHVYRIDRPPREESR
jgi:aminoglycoside 6'-N-acetyltransferase